MKKTFSLWLAIVLAMTLIFMFTACGNEENSDDSQAESVKNGDNNAENDDDNAENDDDNAGNSGSNNTTEKKYVTVTQEEWIKAFTFDGVNSFTYVYDDYMTKKYNGETVVYKYVGSYVYANGYYYDECTNKNGETTTKYEEISNFDIYDFKSGAHVYDEAMDDYLSDSAEDYNYSLFSYNSEKGCYEYVYESDSLTLTFNFYFGDDKRVSKVYIDWYRNGLRRESVSYFSKYNSTEAITQ